MPALTTPLVPINVASIYNKAALPTRMSRCTPDTALAIQGVVDDLKSLGYDLRLSDLFRNYDMQRQANLDYLQGRKKAFSPPPGGSMHEAGRAMDIDLSSIGVPLKKFWEVVHAHGWVVRYHSLTLGLKACCSRARSPTIFLCRPTLFICSSTNTQGILVFVGLESEPKGF